MRVERELVSRRDTNENRRQVLRPSLCPEEHDPLEPSIIGKACLELLENLHLLPGCGLTDRALLRPVSI